MVPVTVAWAGEDDAAERDDACASAGRSDRHPRAAGRGRAGPGLPRDLLRQPLERAHLAGPARCSTRAADPPPTEVDDLAQVLTPDVRHLVRLDGADGGRRRHDARRGGGPRPRTSPRRRCAARGSPAPWPTGPCGARRTQGDVIEEQVLRDGLWLASLERAGIPSDYGARVARRRCSAERSVRMPRPGARSRRRRRSHRHASAVPGADRATLALRGASPREECLR